MLLKHQENETDLRADSLSNICLLSMRQVTNYEAQVAEKRALLQNLYYPQEAQSKAMQSRPRQARGLQQSVQVLQAHH